MNFRSLMSIVLLFSSFKLAFSQETLPVYSDYLSDNIYLVHPAAAGIGDCGKLRITAQQQWMGVSNAPSFQTISYNSQLGDKAGFGFIVFNDANGYHNQIGFQGTYAYHLSLGGWKFNQLSFGFSASIMENNFRTDAFSSDLNTGFMQDNFVDRGYFNADLSVAYYYDAFYAYATAKNLFVTDVQKDEILYEKQNLRNYLVNLGYYYGENRFLQFEPSVMFKYFEETKELFTDFNLKLYHPLNRSLIWGAISYRRSFNSNPISGLNYISPIVGVNVGRMMMSYTYTKQVGDLLLDRAGFHQISIGFNLFCRKTRASSCPNPSIKMPFYY